jgi:hypothetical protein
MLLDEAGGSNRVPVSRFIFPVMAPIISLLIPCYDFRMEAIYSSPYQRIDAIEPLGGAKFPVFFPVNGNFGAETGSQQTASTAMQSAAQRIVL